MQLTRYARLGAAAEIEGREVIVGERDSQERLLGEKVPPAAIPEAWPARVGRYEVVNPDREFPIVEPTDWLEQGALGMSYRMPMLSEKPFRVPIRPISDTEAVILGLGRMHGETLRAVTVDGQEHLRHSGYVGRRVSD